MCLSLFSISFFLSFIVTFMVFQGHLWYCETDIILNIGFTPVLYVLIWFEGVWTVFRGYIEQSDLWVLDMGILIRILPRSIWYNFHTKYDLNMGYIWLRPRRLSLTKFLVSDHYIFVVRSSYSQDEMIDSRSLGLYIILGLIFRC